MDFAPVADIGGARTAIVWVAARWARESGAPRASRCRYLGLAVTRGVIRNGEGARLADTNKMAPLIPPNRYAKNSPKNSTKLVPREAQWGKR